MNTFAFNQPIKFAILPLDENGDPLQADATPVAGNFAAIANGTAKPGVFIIGDWVANYGYLLTFTPADQFAVGDQVTLSGPTIFSTVTETWRETFAAGPADVTTELASKFGDGDTQRGTPIIDGNLDPSKAVEVQVSKVVAP